MTCSRLHHKWAVGEERVPFVTTQPPEEREVFLRRGLEEKQLEKANSTLTVRKFYSILCSFVGKEKKKKKQKLCVSEELSLA